MPLTSSPRETFLLRFWREPCMPQCQEERWRAYVQHISSGEKGYVEDVASLIAFIERWMGPLSSDPFSQPTDPHSLGRPD